MCQSAAVGRSSTFRFLMRISPCTFRGGSRGFRVPRSTGLLLISHYSTVGLRLRGLSMICASSELLAHLNYSRTILSSRSFCEILWEVIDLDLF